MPKRASWQKVFNALPVAEKVRIHTAADKIAGREIRRLSTYKKLAALDKAWHTSHPGILATSRHYAGMVDLYNRHFQAAVASIMRRRAGGRSTLRKRRTRKP